jgi:rhamnosyltransferase
MTQESQVGGVVVTFHPDAGFEMRLAAMLDEVRPVIVIDNTATPATRDRLRAACTRLGAELLENQDNAGLGAALNRAFRVLDERGFTAVIAFDQDSTPESGLAAALVSLMSADPRRAIVGSNWHDEARPRVRSRHLRPHAVLPGCFTRQAASHDLYDITCVITSGSLFHLDAWRELGGFDEPLFVDLVDTEDCLRARTAGHAIAVAAHARLTHRRGAKAPVRRFGFTWWPAFGSPLRLRYLFRNRMLVLGRLGWRMPHWIAFELVYAAKVVTEIVLLEENKVAKLAACAQGTWDGLMGVEGRIASP